MAQLNFVLGRNTAYFHLQHPLPDLTKCVPVKATFDCKDLKPFNCQAPHPEVIEGPRGTPNQKTERIANQIAYYFFTHPDRQKAPAVYKAAESFFDAQAASGHQYVGTADEGLTASHGPIWWRAIASLRITSWAIANGQVPWLKDNGLEQRILGWIQWHQELGALGEIQGGPQKGKVLLPGARWLGSPTLFPDPCPKIGAADPRPGGRYPADPLTDQVSNVIYQLIKTGKVSGVPWKLGPNFWILDPCALDRVGAVLVRSAVEHGLGFSMPQAGPPKLHSQLVVDRYPGGHVANYPCRMPKALTPSLWAWADYATGCMSLSADGNPPPPKFSGTRQRTVVASALPCP